MPEDFNSGYSSHFYYSGNSNSIFGPNWRGMTTYDLEQQHFDDYFLALELVDIVNLERQYSDNMLVCLLHL